MLCKWFFEFNASLRSTLFPGRELDDFHRFHQVYYVSFGNLGRMTLGHWFFELNASLRSQSENLRIFTDSIRFLTWQVCGKFLDISFGNLGKSHVLCK